MFDFFLDSASRGGQLHRVRPKRAAEGPAARFCGFPGAILPVASPLFVPAKWLRAGHGSAHTSVPSDPAADPSDDWEERTGAAAGAKAQQQLQWPVDRLAAEQNEGLRGHLHFEDQSNQSQQDPGN